MHDGVDPPVEEAVLGLEARYPEGAGGIVSAAAAVRPGEAPQLRVLPRRVALAAPLGARYPEDVRNVAATSVEDLWHVLWAIAVRYGTVCIILCCIMLQECILILFTASCAYRHYVISN